MSLTTIYDMYPRPKTEEPCGAYFGNVCTGFGDDDQTCKMCGWQRNEHPSEYVELGRLA